MNIRENVLNTLNLAYKETLITSPKQHSDIIRKMSTLLVKEVSQLEETDEEKVFVEILTGVANKLVSRKSPTKLDVLVAEIRLSSIETFENVEDDLLTILGSDTDDEVNLKTSIATLGRQLTKAVLLEQSASEIFHIYSKINNETNSGDFDKALDLMGSLKDNLEVYATEATDNGADVIDELDFGDTDSLLEAFEKMYNASIKDGGSSFSTGSTDLDKALGRLRKRKLVCVMALQYKNKSGFIRSLLAGIASNNYPEISDEDLLLGKYYEDQDDGTKILKDNKGEVTTHSLTPLILKVTLEDEVEDDLKHVYRYFKVRDEGKLVTQEELLKIDKHELIGYAKEKMMQNGFAYKVIRLDPSQTSYMSLFAKFDALMAEGYRLDVIGIDYLTLTPTTGCRQGVVGDDIMDLFRKFRGYISVNNILGVTPHQLRTAAKDLLADEAVTDKTFARDIAGGGYSSGSRSIDRELDYLMNIHIVHHNDGKFYQSVFVEKVRGFVIPPSVANLYIEFTKGDGPLIISDKTVKRQLPVATAGF